MGKCISKTTSNSKSSRDQSTKSSTKLNKMYYKPKISSNSLIGCRLTDKAFTETPILGSLNFQSSCIFRKLDSVRYICIGGLNNGDQALILNLFTKTYEQIISPPMSLAYGNMIPYENKLYIIGSLTIESSGQEKRAPPLSYDLAHKI